MDKIKIYKSKVDGRITLPASKSDAHRKIICASLAMGQKSTLTNVTYSNDINATIDCMNKLGANIKKDGDNLLIEGIKSFNKVDQVELDATESGSTLRFLLPVASLLANKVIFKGSKKLLSRPLDVYQDIYLDNMKINSEYVELTSSLEKSEYEVRGDISSQFISGLLFASTLMNKKITIKIVNKFESKSYVLMTLKTLNEYGVNYSFDEINNVIVIEPTLGCKATNKKVEGDCSQLAFLGALGLINNDVLVEGIPSNTLQGDKKIIDFYKEIGGEVVQVNEEAYLFCKSELKGGTIDIEDTPDLGPILIALGSLCEDGLTLLNTRRLKIKESDRVLAMKEELKKYGVEILDEENKVLIKKQELKNPLEEINPHNDHRILMSLSVLSTLLEETKFINKECVNKSYPGFFIDLKNLGVKEEEIND
jgi:3-phosphoshikimate 1-carboxyvinyltransferase